MHQQTEYHYYFLYFYFNCIRRFKEKRNGTSEKEIKREMKKKKKDIYSN
jgi:hypothetical protein